MQRARLQPQRGRRSTVSDGSAGRAGKRYRTAALRVRTGGRSGGRGPLPGRSDGFAPGRLDYLSPDSMAHCISSSGQPSPSDPPQRVPHLVARGFRYDPDDEPPPLPKPKPAP